LTFPGMICPALYSPRRTILSENHFIHNLQLCTLDRFFKDSQSGFHSLFPSDKEDPFSIVSADLGNVFIGVFSYGIICEIYRILIHPFSCFSFFRRRRASSIVSFSLAECSRMRLLTSSLKKLDPGPAATLIFLIIHSRDSRSLYPSDIGTLRKS